MTPTDQQLLKQLPRNHGAPPLFRLRWRFEYTNRKDKVGCWNGSSARPEDKACFAPKDGLLWAVIEGEKIGAWTVKEFLRIPGPEYFHSKWNAAVSAPMFLGKTKHTEAKVSPDIVGLTMLTRKNAYTVLVDGRLLKRELTPDERSIKLTEHSIGV